MQLINVHSGSAIKCSLKNDRLPVKRQSDLNSKKRKDHDDSEKENKEVNTLAANDEIISFCLRNQVLLTAFHQLKAETSYLVYRIFDKALKHKITRF